MHAFDHPLIVLVTSLIVQWAATYAGDLFRKKARPLREVERADFDIIRAATLTLLGLIIGFSFAMAVTRYDQRKNYEESEANAIGTEYVRADLLPADDASRVRELLRKYVELRISFYVTHDEQQVDRINADTAMLQAELWSSVARVAQTQQTPIMALAVWGMNDVLNSQGYTQSAWWNRIPVAAWALMILIAVSCNLLFGYGEHRTSWLAFILPVIVSISFFLIADIDSPRAGVIKVVPYNLIALSQSVKAR